MAASIICRLQSRNFLRFLLKNRYQQSVKSWPSVLAVKEFHRTTPVYALSDDFQKAKDRLNTLKEDPGNEVKLKIYALFKQATEGKNTKKKPGMMDFVGKVKWEAWNDLGEMSKDDAMTEYIKMVDDLAAKEK